MKIVKKQAGGFLQYKPQATPIEALSWVGAGLNVLMGRKQGTGEASTSASSSKKEGSSGDIGLLTKDMVKLLYENGLPNDVDQFLQNVDIFSKQIDGNPFAGGGSSTAVQEAQYKQILSILPKLKLNKDQYDASVKHAEENNTITETAISPDGRVYVQDEDGDLIKKHISELSKTEAPITVGELARIRAYSPSASFDGGDIAQTIANSLSRDQVFKSIQAIVDKIGTDTSASDQYVRKDSSESKAAAGIKQLIQEAEDGTYKIRQERSSQERKAINYALKYIWETLPTNARVLLQDYSRKNGMDIKKGPLIIIEDFIKGQLDDTLKTTITESEDTARKKNSSGNGSDEDLKNAQDVNQSMQVVTGDFLPTTHEYITPGNNSYAYNVKVSKIPYLQEAGGNGNIGPGKFSDAIALSKVGNVIDKSSIHAGSQLLTSYQLSRIYYDGQGAQTMELPFTTDANGKVMPDWSLMQSFAEAQKEIERNPNLTEQQQNQIYKKHGLGEFFIMVNTGNGVQFKPNRQKYRRFVAFNVMGDEGAFKDPDDHSDVFTEVDEDGVEEMLSKALGDGDKHQLDIEGDIYRTVVYAPVFDSPTNAMMAGGTPLKIPLQSAESRYIEEDKIHSQIEKPHNTQYTKSQI